MEKADVVDSTARADTRREEQRMVDLMVYSDLECMCVCVVCVFLVLGKDKHFKSFSLCLLVLCFAVLCFA